MNRPWDDNQLRVEEVVDDNGQPTGEEVVVTTPPPVGTIREGPRGLVRLARRDKAVCFGHLATVTTWEGVE